MRLLILSRREAENFSIIKENCFVTHAWISIAEPFCLAPNPVQNELCRGILRIFCHDIDHPVSNSILFSEKQAQEVKTFVDSIRDEISLLCIHCEAGISRSAGLGAAISLWLNGHDSGIGTDPHFFPNKHIQTLALRVFQGS